MDPNKYAKNQSIEPESKFKTIQAIVSFLLMLIGLVGIAVEFFRPSGGLHLVLGFATQSTFNMILSGFIAIGLFVFHRYISHVKAENNKKAGNAPMFFMMVIGIYYVIRLISTGGL